MSKRDTYKLLAERYEQITEKEEAQLISLTESEVEVLSQIGFTYYIKDKAALKEGNGTDIVVKRYNHGFYELLVVEGSSREVYDFVQFDDLIEELIK
ncbi:MAG: hypothetical protein EB127_13785 [Alphaproteobacteria bacterium]|nr:hypothetical protein [Alphaproteobacteria bacterium]